MKKLIRTIHWTLINIILFSPLFVTHIYANPGSDEYWIEEEKKYVRFLIFLTIFFIFWIVILISNYLILTISKNHPPKIKPPLIIISIIFSIINIIPLIFFTIMLYAGLGNIGFGNNREVILFFIIFILTPVFFLILSILPSIRIIKIQSRYGQKSKI